MTNFTKKNNYDCIIPVSGGKDSYCKTHLIKSFGLNPLLVTYNGNNYSKEVGKSSKYERGFGVDHIFYSQHRCFKNLNRMGMLMMGDMNWHAHAGILLIN